MLLSACSEQFCGSVQTTQGNAISNATVGWQTSARRTKSDIDGQFCIPKDESLSIISAWANGYLIGGGPAIQNGPTVITLTELPHGQLNAKDYTWLDSIPKSNKNYPAITPSSNEPCSACHPRISQEWQASAHGHSHQNNLLTQVLTNIPQSRQEKCQQCHNPQQHHKPGNIKQAIGCDYCHKIKEVHNQSDEIFGAARIKHYIPKNGALAIAQLDDPVGRNDYYAPLYKKSEYCSACHQASFWHTPIYSTYSEWQTSPQAAQNIQCQNCHMKTQAHFSADPKLGGKKRDPATLSSHDFNVTPTRISQAIEFTVAKDIQDNALTLTVNLNNTRAGHDIPTGNPMHHLVLRVQVVDDKGDAIKQQRGARLPSWSLFANNSGTVMAKILAAKNNYKNAQPPVYPSPFWQPSVIESDTRLKPGKPQAHTFSFAGAPYYQVHVQLWYVKHYANWQGLAPPKPWLLHEWQNTINLKSPNKEGTL